MPCWRGRRPMRPRASCRSCLGRMASCTRRIWGRDRGCGGADHALRPGCAVGAGRNRGLRRLPRRRGRLVRSGMRPGEAPTGGRDDMSLWPPRTDARFMVFAITLIAIFVATPMAHAADPDGGSVLPFPPTPSASVAGQTLQESQHRRRVEPNRLPAGAPNILIVLLDDVGFGLPDTFGGEIHTPTLTRLAQSRASATTRSTRRRSARRRARRC